MAKRPPKQPPPNWIIQAESVRGPLHLEQIQKLARDFSLPEASVFSLSQALAYHLSPDLTVRGVLEVLQRQKRGAKEADDLITKIRLAQKNLSAAKELFAQIDFNFPRDETDPEDMNNWLRTKLDVALANTAILRAATSRAVKLHGQRFVGIPDKRRKTDFRRKAVFKAIFDTWHNAGRKVTVTTQGALRGGPLVDFSRAVVRCVTDPPYELSGETVWQEIKALRKNKLYK